MALRTSVRPAPIRPPMPTTSPRLTEKETSEKCPADVRFETSSNVSPIAASRGGNMDSIGLLTMALISSGSVQALVWRVSTT